MCCLSLAQVQGPLNTYQRRACLVLLTVVAIQLAAFAVMYEEMMTQISLENNLAYIGAHRTVLPSHTISISAAPAQLDARTAVPSGVWRSAGRAGAYAAEVGTLAHYLVMLYTNNTAPGLRYLTGPSDIPYIKQVRRRAPACGGAQRSGNGRPPLTRVARVCHPPSSHLCSASRPPRMSTRACTATCTWAPSPSRRKCPRSLACLSCGVSAGARGLARTQG